MSELSWSWIPAWPCVTITTTGWSASGQSSHLGARAQSAATVSTSWTTVRWWGHSFSCSHLACQLLIVRWPAGPQSGDAVTTSLAVTWGVSCDCIYQLDHSQVITSPLLLRSRDLSATWQSAGNSQVKWQSLVIIRWHDRSAGNSQVTWQLANNSTDTWKSAGNSQVCFRHHSPCK